jgi:hypothetical protein
MNREGIHKLMKRGSLSDKLYLCQICAIKKPQRGENKDNQKQRETEKHKSADESLYN